MAQFSSNTIHSQSLNPSYSRKQQSLGLLCSSFLSLYDRDGVETIGLDDARARLGVGRRRIYDILNILESIGLLTKKGKNHYSWKGFGVLPKTLQLLKQEGPKDSYTSFDENVFLKACDDVSSSQNDKSNGSSVSKLSRIEPFKSDNRIMGSCLGLLTQNFVKIFLCSDVEMILLDDAAKILLGDVQDPLVIKAKMRRLYEIANVLSSMNFIEKTRHPETRKPAFRWIGIRGEPQMATTNELVPVSKKRIFGNELPDTSCIKRRVVAPSTNAATDPTTVTQSQANERIVCTTSKKVVDETDLKERSRGNVQKYQFGPFSMTYVPNDKPKTNNNGVRDWESLAVTYSPQYHNQAVRDIFRHFMGAWNSYHSQVAGENPL
ncbi:E2F transcription factor-like [Heracleum sosnowskyi]|uniref:E2F transcription factor-like n=1 Tax=Heracleum sosnowskyi TaxID=360622 RepID=A0AAD8H4Y2_9APIA|nr:E2F transcription factor-like [Heracleum sosnowskyi]